MLPGGRPALEPGMDSVHPSPSRRHPFQLEEGVLNFPREVYPTHRINGVAKIAGARINYTYELPEEVTDEVPLVILPGYGGANYANFRQAVAARGKPAVSYRPPRNQRLLAGLRPAHLADPARLQSQAAWGVVRDIADTLRHQQFDFSLHSRGGQTGTDLAIHKPDYVRSMIFVGSSGLDGHSIADMAARIPRFLSGELLPALPKFTMDDSPVNMLDCLHYFLRSPLRTMREGVSIANSDIRTKVATLGKLGIKTAALQFARDSFFPLESVEASSAHLFDVFMVYPDPNAGHMTPQLEPQRTANAHLAVLEELHAA